MGLFVSFAFSFTLLTTCFIPLMASLPSSAASIGADGSLSAEIDLDAPDPPPGTLLLPGRKFPLDYAGGEFRIHDIPVFIKEVHNSGLGTGLTVWDGSVVLAKYLEKADIPISGSRVLELGSGTGLVGIVASVLGAAHVTLTDLEYTLGNLRTSVKVNEANLKGAVEIAELDWYKPEASKAMYDNVEYVLAADVVWVESLIPPLVRTMNEIATRVARRFKAAPKEGEQQIRPEFLIAHQTRSAAGDELFFKLLDANGFKTDFVPFEELHPKYRDPAIKVIKAIKTPR